MRVPLTLAFLLGATPAFAQQPGVAAPEAVQSRPASGQPTTADVADLRVSQVIVFGDDACPPPANPNEEIVVCARFREDERFRIPENLRGDPNAPENQSWTNRAIELSYVGRSGIGSCSPVGGAGFTGCNQQLINQAVAERRGRPEVNWARLIEQARQERLSGINTASSEEELAAGGNRRLQQLRIQPGQLCPPSTEAVVITCTYPDGTSAPVQPSGEPVIPIGGRVQPATPTTTPQPN